MSRFWKFVLMFVLAFAIYLGYMSRDTFDPGSVRGKRVIVTGASTGIGEQIAYHYARLGARILITARRENVLKQVTAKCLELGAQEAYYLPLDMAKVNETGKLINEADKKLGGLDYLILNHALFFTKLWDGNMETLQNYMNVNFMSFVNLATTALPMLTKSNGSIVAVSSAAGYMGVPTMASYSASKFAVHGFVSALRQELKILEKNISVTLCVLGYIRTEHAVEHIDKTFHLEPDYAISVEDTAMAIIKAAATRVRELYFPKMLRFLQIMYTIAPGMIDKQTTDALKIDNLL